MCRAPKSVFALPQNRAGLRHHHGTSAVQQGQSLKIASADWTNLDFAHTLLLRECSVVARLTNNQLGCGWHLSHVLSPVAY